MSKWRDDWPGENDVGRRVELELADGRKVEGALLLDHSTEHDPDDAPLFLVQDDAGVTHRLVNVANWRFSEHSGAAPWPLSSGDGLASAALDLQRRVRYLELEIREAIQPLLRWFISQTGLAPIGIEIDL